MRKLKYAVATVITTVMITTVCVCTAFVGGVETAAEQQGENKEDTTVETTETTTMAATGGKDASMDAPTVITTDSIPADEATANNSTEKKAGVKEIIDNLGTGEIVGVFLTIDIVLLILVLVLSISLSRLRGELKKFKKAVIERNKEFDEKFVSQDVRVADVENGIEKLDGPMTRMQTRLNALASSMSSYNQSTPTPAQQEKSKPKEVVSLKPVRPKTADDFFVDFINSKDGVLPDGFKSVSLSMNDGNVREDNSGYQCFIRVEDNASDEVKLYPGRNIKFANFRRYYSVIFDTEGDGKQVYGILPCKAIRNSNGDYEIRSKGRVQF